MSWHFLQEQEEASWEASSLDGAPSALLKLIHIAETSCLPDKETEFCHTSQSGTMCARSMADLGAERSMSSAEGSRARTSVQPAKKTGISGKRSGLWSEYARIIGEVRPRFAFIENSPLLRGHGLVRVLKDLASLGYNAEWAVLSAREVGAPHLRKRMWVVAYTIGMQLRQQSRGSRGKSRQDPRIIGINGQEQYVAHTNSSLGKVETTESSVGSSTIRTRETQSRGCDGHPRLWWGSEPDVGRVANGVASRMDRLKAIGNGQVPAVAATAWRFLGVSTG